MVFSDDWGRHPSSSQHIFRRLLSDYDVQWINTIGMRPPSLSWSTLTRAGQKCGDFLFRRSSGQSQDHSDVCPTISNPVMWPWFRKSIDRALNRRLLNSQLKKLRGADFAVTTVPVVADIMDDLDVGSWTYYCVDDWSTWVGLDHKPLAALEEQVLQKADRIIAASAKLQDRLSQLGYESTVVTHGVELEHWTSVADETLDFLEGLERPLIVQWGLINQNMDVAAIEQLSWELNCGSIVLVGPHMDAPPTLAAVERVHLFPAIPYSQLPQLARESSVLLMAYLANPATVASQPLKLKEYMATGRPVVARRIPATESWADAIDLYETPEELVAQVKMRLEGMPAEQETARERLQDESWDAKAEQFRQLALS